MMKKKKKIRRSRGLSNYDLLAYAKQMQVQLRGVYMLDNLPKKVNINENAIINLSRTGLEGSHWVCFRKAGNIVEYFDPIGNLAPPKLLLKYLCRKNNDCKIYYNFTSVQKVDTNICGELCLLFLARQF